MSISMGEADRFSSINFDEPLPESHHDDAVSLDSRSGDESHAGESTVVESGANGIEGHSGPKEPVTADMLVMRVSEESPIASNLVDTPVVEVPQAVSVENGPVGSADTATPLVEQLDPILPGEMNTPTGGAFLTLVVLLIGLAQKARRKAQLSLASVTDTVKKPATASSTPGPAASTSASAVEGDLAQAVIRKKSAWPLLVTGSVAGIAAALIVTGGVHLPGADLAITATEAAPQLARSSDPVEILTAELAKARVYASAHSGSFSGYVPVSPVMGAAGGASVVLTVKVADRCWSTGITPGYPENEIRFDPSANRCNPQALQALQMQLDKL